MLRVLGRFLIVPGALRHAEPSTGGMAPDLRSSDPDTGHGDVCSLTRKGSAVYVLTIPSPKPMQDSESSPSGGLDRLRTCTPFPRASCRRRRGSAVKQAVLRGYRRQCGIRTRELAAGSRELFIPYFMGTELMLPGRSANYQPPTIN